MSRLIDQEIAEFRSRVMQRVRDTYGDYLDALLAYLPIDSQIVDLNVTLCHALRVLDSPSSGLTNAEKRVLMDSLSQQANLRQYLFVPMAPMLVFDHADPCHLSVTTGINGSVVLDGRTMSVQEAVSILWDKSEQSGAPYAIYGGGADPNVFHVSVRDLD